MNSKVSTNPESLVSFYSKDRPPFGQDLVDSISPSPKNISQYNNALKDSSNSEKQGSTSPAQCHDTTLYLKGDS